MIQRQLEPEVMDQAADAAAYDAMDHNAPNHAFVDRLVELGAYGGMLDIGTGPGHIPLLICQRLPDAGQIVGVDPSQAMLDIAQRHLDLSPHIDQVTYQQADARQLPFDDESFDTVFSNTILHHIDDPRPVLREAWRVLRPGGCFLVRDLFRPDSHDQVEQLVAQHAGDASQQQQQLFRQSLIAALTPDELQAMVDELKLPRVSVVVDSDRHVSIQAPREV